MVRELCLVNQFVLRKGPAVDHVVKLPRIDYSAVEVREHFEIELVSSDDSDHSGKFPLLDITNRVASCDNGVDFGWLTRLRLIPFRGTAFV